MLLELSFAGLLCFPVCALGLPAAGGLRVISHIARLWGWERAPLAKSSQDDVLLGDFRLFFFLRGWESASKRPRVVIKRDVAK